MSSVDDRIVNMQFNNRQFESGVSTSTKTLNDLEKTLANTGKGKGLEQMASSVDGVANRFSAMRIAGITAIATIANKATNAALDMAKKFTISPIMDGWNEYNLNLQSVQTIIANTGAKLPDVTKKLDALNRYSDQTIYNFGEMAKNIGTFTAAGVSLNESVSAIKGISNIAALSGSSSQQASSAMYQLSQAIAAGRVNLQDWNSVVNAGMGGKNLQKALIQTGQAMGKITEKVDLQAKTIKIAGASFRESISAAGGETSWLSSDVLVKTLALMDGRLSHTAITFDIMAKKHVTQAQAAKLATKELEKQQEVLKKQGFNEEQIKNLTEMADRSFQAATVVKTLPQLMGVVQEGLGSMWASAFRGVIGNFNESKKLWTNAGDSIKKVTDSLSGTINDTLVQWRQQGGRLALLDGFRSGFAALGAIMGTVKNAFMDVFPPDATSGLANFSKGFANLMAAIMPSKSTLESLRSIFGGVFAVLHIGITVLGAIRAGFMAFFGEIFKGSGKAGGGILSFVGSIGELLMKLDKFLTSGGKMKDVFQGIGKAAGALVGQTIQIGSDIIGGLLGGIDLGFGQIKSKMVELGSVVINAIKGALGIASPAAELVPVGSMIIAGIVQGISDSLVFIFESMSLIGSAVMGGMKQAFGGMDALDFASLLNAVFTGGLLLTLNRVAKAMTTVLDWKKMLQDTFGQLQSTLKTFQNSLRAKMLKDIAIAVGLLTASLVVLSLIDPEKLAKGLGGIGAMLALLVGTMAALSKVAKGDVGIFTLAASITLIAGAMVMLATSVAILGSMDLTSLAKGVGAMAAIMAIMVGALKALAGLGPVAKGAGAAMVLMALAMNILAGAIFALGSMDVKTLAKGLGAIAIGLILFVAALGVLTKIGPGVAAASAGIFIAASAMVVMAAAVLAFGKMNFGTLAKGFAAIAVALFLMVAALGVLGANAAGTIAAAGAMLILATAMAMLVPVIMTLGNMDMETLIKGMAGLAVALLLFVAAIAALGAVAMIVGPGLLILGASLALIGIGMAAFGAGFALLAATGTAGIAVMGAAITAFIMLLPSIAIQMAAAFVSFLETLAAAAPRVRKAMATIFKEMLGVVRDAIPEIGKLIQKLITTAIGILRNSIPQWVEMGFTVIDKFIESAAKHVPNVAKNGIKLIADLITAIGNEVPKLADAAGKAIVKFINGIADAIDNNAGDLQRAGLNLARAIIDGMTGGLLSTGLDAVRDAAEQLADALPGWMKKVLGISSPSKVTHKIGYYVALGLARGIVSGIKTAVSAATQMANAVIAEGSSAVLKAQKMASAAQRKADKAQAKADATRQAANRIRKTNPKLAKQLRAEAEKQQKLADAAQAAADRADQRVEDTRTFEEADLHGKGEIKDAQAVRLAERAEAMLAKANAEAARARKLMETNAKAGKAMLEQARKDARLAKKLAAKAQAAHAAAQKFYAMEVNERIKQLEEDRAADEAAQRAQEEYDAADAVGKAEILRKRAEANEAKAEAAKAEALALIESAKALAATDATKAMELLDKAEEAAAIAEEAAKQAQQEREQAQTVLNQGGSTPGSSGPIQPSRTILEDAASSVDRYTASLAQAAELAGATQQPIQFIQNNTSPEALSVSEVYRQSKNLLSAAEVKMGVTP